MSSMPPALQRSLIPSFIHLFVSVAGKNGWAFREAGVRECARRCIVILQPPSQFLWVFLWVFLLSHPVVFVNRVLYFFIPPLHFPLFQPRNRRTFARVYVRARKAGGPINLSGTICQRRL